MTAEQVRSALSRLRLRPEIAGIMLNAPVRTIQRWRKEGAKRPVVRLLELYQGIGPIGPRGRHRSAIKARQNGVSAFRIAMTNP